ncbi:MAG: enoyl-CoA hydratase/isomerase family protein [Gammaproteobacteria bacterium]|nr:enoyl-CoA hydratase/isomerase family protein [Gammaproteobacteria bacterium]
MSDYQWIIVDRPLPGVQRITLNRPEKRNPLSNLLRTELFDALIQADQDPELRVTILRGAGGNFSAGYDLKQDSRQNQPFHTAGGLGNWPRHVVDGFLQMWDLAKPVIAQVEGYCLAGGTELATACDLVYAAEDAKIGYPVVRSISPPDNQFYPWIVGLRRAMEMMLTGDSISGIEAAECGFANRAFPADQLEAEVLRVAEKIARVPPDIQQINKRAVHRQMELMGMRAAIRSGTELQTLSMLTPSARSHLKDIAEGGLTQALSKRDKDFGDYRESNRESKE